MANGDIAASAGLPVVPSTGDIRDGYDNINELADSVATHMTARGHLWSRINSKPTLYDTDMAHVSDLPDIAPGNAAQAGKLPIYNAASQLTTATPSLAGHCA